MGNHMSHRPSKSKKGKIIILEDGTVHEYDKPLVAAELMLEHPQQVVVEFQSAVLSGKKPTPLPADMKLDPNKLYIMLPIKRGKPLAVSSDEAPRLLSMANSVLKSQFLLSAEGFIPLFARICGHRFGGGRSYVGKRKGKPVEKKEDQESKRRTESLTEMLEMEGRQPEYLLSRTISGKGWKPSLDTITEKGFKTKVPHWLL